MAEQKVDRRVRRTKKLLLQGLVQLMAQKPVNNITITELTELVDINRGTFYLYYDNIFDMVEKIKKELFDTFHENFSKYINGKVDYDAFYEILKYAFIFIQENLGIAKILLGPNGDHAFIETFKRLIIEEMTTNRKLDQSNYEIKYIQTFVISGHIGLIKYWLENGMQHSPERMADITMNLLMNSIKTDHSGDLFSCYEFILNK